MVTDIHTHAFRYPEHFTELAREQVTVALSGDGAAPAVLIARIIAQSVLTGARTAEAP